MSRLQPQPSDPDQHKRAIESLSDELKLSRTKVEVAYAIVLRRLQKGATVTQFLTVFAKRGARECLLCVERKARCASRDDCLHALWHESATVAESPPQAPAKTATH